MEACYVFPLGNESFVICLYSLSVFCCCDKIAWLRKLVEEGVYFNLQFQRDGIHYGWGHDTGQGCITEQEAETSQPYLQV